MKRDLLQSINQEIYRRYPEFAGVSPKVEEKQPGSRTSGTDRKIFLLTYQQRGSLPDGKSLPRYLRVTADDKGKIVKVSTSR